MHTHTHEYAHINSPIAAAFCMSIVVPWAALIPRSSRHTTCNHPGAMVSGRAKRRRLTTSDRLTGAYRVWPVISPLHHYPKVSTRDSPLGGEGGVWRGVVVVRVGVSSKT